MISDEVLSYFRTKGYNLPPSGLPCVKMNTREGEIERWQLTLFSRATGKHIFEQAGSPVEVVSKMVVRLSGESQLTGGREHDAFALFETALSGLTFSLAGNTHART